MSCHVYKVNPSSILRSFHTISFHRIKSQSLFHPIPRPTHPSLHYSSLKMVQLSTVFGIVSSAALAAAAPAGSSLESRATCTFTGSTGAADALKNKASCTTITLNNVAVPAGTTLDLTGLKTGTNVSFYRHKHSCLLTMSPRLCSRALPLSASRTGQDH